MGFPKGGRRISTGQAGGWNFILPNVVGHSARSVLNHNGNWENTQSVWCQTCTDSTTSELTERLQNDQLLPKRPTPRPHTSNFPTDVSKRNFVAETDYPLIAHSHIDFDLAVILGFSGLAARSLHQPPKPRQNLGIDSIWGGRAACDKFRFGGGQSLVNSPNA